MGISSDAVGALLSFLRSAPAVLFRAVEECAMKLVRRGERKPFEFYRSHGVWHWVLRGADGSVLCRSRGYARKGDAKRGFVESRSLMGEVR